MIMSAEITSGKSKNIFRLLRIARDVTVKDLADRLQIAPAYINAIEKDVQVPSKRLIRDYALALDVDERIIHSALQAGDGGKRFERLMLSLLQTLCGSDPSDLA